MREVLNEDGDDPYFNEEMFDLLESPSSSEVEGDAARLNNHLNGHVNI